ncbi:MAG: hypothetical protein ABMA25_24535 [Ilumatobacteraceae bacterium]
MADNPVTPSCDTDTMTTNPGSAVATPATDLRSAAEFRDELREELRDVELTLQRHREYSWLSRAEVSRYQSAAHRLSVELARADAAVVDCWLDEYIPMGKEVGDLLDMAGNRVRRRVASQALLRMLHLPEEVRPSTLALVHSHIERIVELRRWHRLHMEWYLPSVSTPRGTNVVSDGHRWPARALADFGWTSERVPPPATVEDLDKAITAAYRTKMSERMTPLLRSLAKDGWFVLV